MNKYLYFFIASLISVFFSAKLLINNSHLGIMDWDQHLAFGEVIRKSVLVYHQLPFWNPYHCGGSSLIGFPENEIFSINTLFILIFGTVTGYKVVLGVKLLIGFFGFYLLGKYLKLSTIATLTMAVSYFLSGHFVVPFLAGMTNFITLIYMPYLGYFYLRAINEKKLKYALLTAIILTIQFLSGFHYISIFLIGLGIFSITVSINRQQLFPLKYIVIVTILFSLLSAPKLLPSINTVATFGTFYENIQSGYSSQSFIYSLLHRNQTFEGFGEFRENPNFLTGRSFGLDENDNYIGVICIWLFAIGIYYKKTRHPELLVTAIILVWASFGDYIWPNLHRLIQQIPFLDSIRVAQRYRWIYMLIFSIYIGYGMNYFEEFLKQYKIWKLNVSFLGGLLFLYIVFDLISVNFNTLLQSAFFMPPAKIITNEKFSHICTNEIYNKSGWTGLGKMDSNYLSSFSSAFLYTTANIGINKSCYELVNYNNYPKCQTEAGYIGEHYLAKSGKVIEPKYWSLNKIDFDFVSDQDEILVVNQNYYAAWFVINNKSLKRATSYNGLISTKIAAGRVKVSFIYIPVLFCIGVISFTVTIIFIRKYFLKYPANN